MIDQSRHGDTASETFTQGASAFDRERSWFGRLCMRIQVEREIDDLTRDHDRDQRVLADAAVRLPSDGLAIGLLFRAAARRAGARQER